MENALIVSSTDKGAELLTELLNDASLTQIATSPSCTDARRILAETNFDLIVINAPLKDETGERFARSVAAKGASQVILVVKAENHTKVSESCERDGIMTIAKPINKEVLLSTLRLANSAQNRLKKAFEENERLHQKIEDIRIIDRAKCILISHMNMSEQEAHRYIEKQAMDMRSTKRVVAEGLLKTYEN